MNKIDSAICAALGIVGYLAGDILLIPNGLQGFKYLGVIGVMGGYAIALRIVTARSKRKAMAQTRWASVLTILAGVGAFFLYMFLIDINWTGLLAVIVLGTTFMFLFFCAGLLAALAQTEIETAAHK